MLGSCATASSATVYRWVDDNGVVHYSDQPNPKAQKVEIADAQTYSSKSATVTGPAPAAARPAGGAGQVCAIDTPAAGQVYLDTFSLTGHVTLVRAGDNPALRLDGLDISGLLEQDGSFMLSQLQRGDHALTLQVTNARGEVSCQGQCGDFFHSAAGRCSRGTRGCAGGARCAAGTQGTRRRSPPLGRMPIGAARRCEVCRGF